MSSEDKDRKALGMWCPRCQSRKVVEGQLGESSRFYPARPLFKALKGKPVELNTDKAFGCARCGLTWSELDPEALQHNIRKYGLSPHSDDVMKLVAGERTGALQLPTESTPSRDKTMP
jgi:hypothetical protein